MTAVRLIARLDVKGANLIKGIHLEGLRVIGDPGDHAERYYRQGIDELIFMDAVANLYGRNNLLDIVESTTADVFVPITVGGGIRSIEDIHQILRAGADKVAINTAAIARPELIGEAAAIFGNQCIVVSIDAKRQPDGSWEAFVETGRERTGKDAIEWAARAVSLGAGEVLLTSVDREGTLKGFDLELLARLSEAVAVPVIASGGAGCAAHVVEAIRDGHADAVAVASVLHYGKAAIDALKRDVADAGIHMRPVGPP